MNYCICDQDGIITNIIVADSAKRAGQMGALPSYDDARIGEKYVLPADLAEKTLSLIHIWIEQIVPVSDSDTEGVTP